MKSTLHIFGNTHSLQCRSPIIVDTDLQGVDLGKVSERFCERLAQPFSIVVLYTNLLMSSTFPLTYPCPKIIQECIHTHNVSKGHILKKNGSVMLVVNRETVPRLFQLKEQPFIDLTPVLFVARFAKKANDYKNVIEKIWTEYFYKGGSRLPKTLKKSLMTT